MDSRFSSSDDAQMKAWLQQLPAASPSEDLLERTMDEVYEVARVARQAQRPWQIARRAGLLSALLASAMLPFFLPGLQPELSLLAEGTDDWLLRSSLLASWVGVLLWQIDGLLMLRQSRRS